MLSQAKDKKSQNISYDIASILDETIIDDKPHYLIKWKGFSATESTWEPIDNLLDVLDVLHSYKCHKNAHSRVLVEEDSSANEASFKMKKKTKKIGEKEHHRKQEQKQRKLHKSRKQEQKKKKKLKKISNDSSINLLSSDQEEDFIRQIDTNETSAPPKSQKRKKEKQRTKSIKKSQDKSAKNPHKEAKQQMNGFKIVGKITRQGVHKIVCCFDWEKQKMCEVELKDGRTVNMKRDDIKKICPEKLCDYFEKIEKV